MTTFMFLTWFMDDFSVMAEPFQKKQKAVTKFTVFSVNTNEAMSSQSFFMVFKSG